MVREFAGLIVITMMFVLYIAIVPALVCLALRLVLWFSELLRIPEALGRFAAKLTRAFRTHRSPGEFDPGHAI